MELKTRKRETRKTIRIWRRVLNSLEADVFCLQEVENAGALEKLISYMPDYKYTILNSANHSKQNVAAIYKKDIDIKTLGEYTPVAVEFGKTRPGLLLNAKKGSLEAIIQVVHLKSTSRYDSTKALKDASREIRAAQASILSIWADSISKFGDNKNFIILGDFNDSPIRKQNPTLDLLYANPNIKFLTDSLKSCKFRNAYAIDHILISKNLIDKYVPESLFIYDAGAQFNESELKGLSDHCPVIVKFRIK